MIEEKIKVHIADDHKILIEGITALVGTDYEIIVEGYSLTGKEVIEWFEQNHADVLILDINMPDLDGVGVLKTFKNRNKEQKILILSSLSDPSLVQELISLGANGFIEKGVAGEHLIEAIKAVHKGETYYSDEIKAGLLNQYVNEIQPDNGFKSQSFDKLTERDKKILKLIAQEKSIQEIADSLNVSTKTIEAERKKLFNQLNVKNMVGLAMYAVKNNIV